MSMSTSMPMPVPMPMPMSTVVPMQMPVSMSTSDKPGSVIWIPDFKGETFYNRFAKKLIVSSAVQTELRRCLAHFVTKVVARRIELRSLLKACPCALDVLIVGTDVDLDALKAFKGYRIVFEDCTFHGLFLSIPVTTNVLVFRDCKFSGPVQVFRDPRFSLCRFEITHSSNPARSTQSPDPSKFHFVFNNIAIDTCVIDSSCVEIRFESESRVSDLLVCNAHCESDIVVGRLAVVLHAQGKPFIQAPNIVVASNRRSQKGQIGGRLWITHESWAHPVQVTIANNRGQLSRFMTDLSRNVYSEKVIEVGRLLNRVTGINL